MNEHTSKKILFNKSTLLSLKAELLKKQEEVCEKKQLPQHKVENFKPAPAKTQDSHATNTNNSEKKSFRDKLKAIDTEEIEACRKAKLALEKKAELYEHLSDNVGNSQLAGRFLVDFDSKKKENPVTSELISPSIEQIQHDNDNESEWMEFTDCLGRTRKCLKCDVELYMKRDKELMRTLCKDRRPSTEEATNETDKIETVSEKPFLVQKTNDYLQSLRQKWEEKEKELLAKDKDIHYQDLLFDEARIHGVGYYSFSTDEVERRKQMEELMKRRQDTLRAQKEAEETRKKRDALIAARVAAARARQRARAGLPPEVPQENTKDFTTCLLEFLTQQKNEADAKAKEEEKKMKDEREKEKQKLREAYIREWDLGKEGVNDKIPKFKEMTQDEYVEQQRAKRIDEFAPPQASVNDDSAHFFDDKGQKVGASTKKRWSDVRPAVPTSPPPDVDYITDPPQKGLYFSTAKKFGLKYKNFVKAAEPTPILNELHHDEDSEDIRVNTEKRKHESNHTEIAPPPTYDYYGPVTKYLKTQKPFESNLREAYDQGSKSLDTKASNRQLPSQYDFTFD